MAPIAFSRQRRRPISIFGFGCLTFGLVAAAASAATQSYPSQVIRIVGPSAAGSPSDISSRIVANELSATEGWRIVVENKPGAMGSIGGSEVLKQPADGYSLLTTALPMLVAPVLTSNVPFRVESDFVPVIRLSTQSQVLVVHPSVPANSLSELIALLKREPDKYTYSSGGFGTPAHLAGESFKLRTGVRATHVPYQQNPRAIADLVAGVNQYMFATAPPVIDLVTAGRLRAIAVVSPNRVAALNDVPTAAEAGFPELTMQSFDGYLVKRGTPNDIVMRLNESINKVLVKPNVREAFAKLGAEPAGGSPAEFAQFMQLEIEHWRKVVKDSKMRMHE